MQWIVIAPDMVSGLTLPFGAPEIILLSLKVKITIAFFDTPAILLASIEFFVPPNIILCPPNVKLVGVWYILLPNTFN